jgi:hypothetical protein
LHDIDQTLCKIMQGVALKPIKFLLGLFTILGTKDQHNI